MSLRIKPYLSLWDKSFEESNTRTYYLTMQLSLHGLYFVVFDPEKNKYLGMDIYHFNAIEEESAISDVLDLIIEQNRWLASPFKKVKLFYNNAYSTLVPEPLYSESEKELFLNFNQSVVENNQVETDMLNNAGSVNVYYLPEPVADKLHQVWTNISITHLSSQMIECLLLNYKNKLDKQTLFVQVNSGSFNMVSIDNNKLHYHNIFSYNTKEDFIYFLLATIEQLGYNPETTELVLMGNIDKSDDLYQIIYQYIGNCHFVKPNKGIFKSYVLDEIRSHQYYLLFNALQCEL
jgi:hypothetical protein